MDGVVLTPLKQIHNVNGDIFHALKSSECTFKSFGEAYFSEVHYGLIKGWKKHTKMELNLIVPVGEIMFVIYDDRKGSIDNGNFKSVVLSLKNYQRLTVSPGLWLGFKGIGQTTNLLLNIASIEHDPNEATNTDINFVDYDWD